MKKEIEIEVESMSPVDSQIGDRIIWAPHNEPEKWVGTVSRIFDGKVFARVDKEYIMRIVECPGFQNRQRKPAHPLTKAFM